jgi:ligand-binding SRPBCC domain-containing protein
MKHFVRESRIAATPQAVFAFHENPDALERLIPPWENVKLVAASGSLKPGSRVVLRSRQGPFSWNWVAEHTEYEPGRMFADRQVQGPFSYWYRRHLFLDEGQGGTILRDEVDYRLPLGMLGERLGQSFVKSRLRKMFDYRHRVTKQLVESGEYTPADKVRPVPGS